MLYAGTHHEGDWGNIMGVVKAGGTISIFLCLCVRLTCNAYNGFKVMKNESAEGRTKSQFCKY